MGELLNSDFFQSHFYGNTVRAWLWFGCLSLILLGIFRVGLGVVKREFAPLARRSKALWDTALMDALDNTRLGFLTTMAFYLGAQTLSLPTKTERGIASLLFLAIFIQGAIWGMHFINSWIRRYIDQTVTDDGAKLTTVNAIAFLVKLLFFVVLTLWTLDNFGINITTFVTGLGIGGIAIALAVQNILGDLFASLTIVLDKPFVIGDSIVVGDVNGTIEYIGLKTTRIRSATGEQVILPNSNLLQSRIHNMKRMQERNVSFKFGLTYDTPQKTLQEIPAMARRAVEAQGNTRFTRAHFISFGDSSLDFEIRYTVLSSDYEIYLDIQQGINIALMKEFEARKIQFAFPTRTVFMQPTPALK